MAISSKPGNDGRIQDGQSDPVKADPNDLAVKRDEAGQQEEKREEKQETREEVLARMSSGEIANRPDEGFISLTKQVPDGEGGVKSVTHGPMPRGEWDEYARKRGL